MLFGRIPRWTPASMDVGGGGFKITTTSMDPLFPAIRWFLIHPFYKSSFNSVPVLSWVTCYLEIHCLFKFLAFFLATQCSFQGLESMRRCHLEMGFCFLFFLVGRCLYSFELESWGLVVIVNWVCWIGMWKIGVRL